MVGHQWLSGKTDVTLVRMTGKRPTGLFITGTNTGVGKTFAATALARTLVAIGCRVGVYKPVMSGCRGEGTRNAESSVPLPASELDRSDDDIRLWHAAGRPGELSQVSPQRFRAALVPHLAARAEGRFVDSRLLRTGILPWQASSDLVIVEGAGGLFSPVTDTELSADLACDFGFPLVLVAVNMLGVIHATLATLFAARAYRAGLNIAAVVLNEIPDGTSDLSRASNLEELRCRCAPSPVFRLGPNELQISELASWVADAVHPEQTVTD